jgi:hypothetical protein
MATIHLTARRCAWSAWDEAALRRRVEKLERRFGSVAADRLHVTAAVTRFANRGVYNGSFRVAAGDALYAATRNAAPTLHALVTEAFRDLQDQLQRRQDRRRSR